MNIFKEIETELLSHNLHIDSFDHERPWGGFFVIEEQDAQRFSDIYFEGFDIDIGELLVSRSKEALLTMAMELTSDADSESGDLMSIEGLDMSLALELSQKGIENREDLAEQSVDELIEIIDISEEDAASLIMRARAHWFED